MSTEQIGVQDRSDQTRLPSDKPSLVDIMRAFGVTIGPSLLLGLFTVTSTLAIITGRIMRPKKGIARLLRPLAIFGAVFPWAYALVVRPWHLRWGTTDEEAGKTLPGDELVPNHAIESTRGITVHAPVEEVWPWLAQIGQDRGGFYSYEWLENLAGCRTRNADNIHPEWQHREVGERVFLHPAIGLEVKAFEPGRAIVLEGWGSFVLEPIDNKSARVILRSRVPRRLGVLLYYLLTIEIPHFIMERRMLKGIKQRAERGQAARTAAPS
jgi:hypothetical protein